MAITSGFFNSIDGDRLYNAEEMTNYFEGLVSDGVYESVGDAFIVLAGGGMGITVGTGRALAKLHWVKNTEVLPLTIAAADVQYDRYDAVVVRCDTSDDVRSVSLEIKQGTPAKSPMYPPVTSSPTVKELHLAYIHVRKGATNIYQSDIKDMRGSTYCRWVTGVVQQVDTSQLFLQWQTAYETYFAESTAAFNAYFAQAQEYFENWFANLNASLGVNTELHKYQMEYTFPAGGDSFELDIPEYEQGDVILAYVNGIMLTQKEPHEVDGTESHTFAVSPTIHGHTGVKFGRDYKAGDIATIICLKSVIGDGINSNYPLNTDLGADAAGSATVATAAFEEVSE